MNIRAKLTLRFSFIVASILLFFSVAIYLISSEYRKEEFYDRLESRATTTARLLVSVDEVDMNLLQIIDKNSVPTLPQEQICIYNQNNQLLYCSTEGDSIRLTDHAFKHVKKLGTYRFRYLELERVGFMYKGKGGEQFVVVASGHDRYGRRKLKNLSTVLIIGLLFGIGIIVGAGRLFAGQVLQPLSKMNQQVSMISAGNLDRRIDEGNQTDEIAQLAMNFNRMLQRIETAFEVQQGFVSNASHELRTPLAAMRSQLQVILEKERTTAEYKQVLQSLLEDTNNFSKLTKGLLLLAQSGVDTLRRSFTTLRVDEVLFMAWEELAKLQPAYQFHIAYESIPDNEADLTVNGNEQLLSTAFINIMDNACKFSEERSVNVSLSNKGGFLELYFQDNGIGISEDDLPKIFTPFYRAENGRNMAKGHGIGLSLCQKIVQLHGGKIIVHSAPGIGSSFLLKLPLC